QVGRELDAGEAHAEHLREAASRKGLRESGVVLEQDVPVREEPAEDALELLSLADDRSLDLVECASGELLDAFEVHHLDPLERLDDAGELGNRDPVRKTVLGRGPVSSHQLPRLVAEDPPRRFRIVVQPDTSTRLEELARELAQPQTEAAVQVG